MNRFRIAAIVVCATAMIAGAASAMDTAYTAAAPDLAAVQARIDAEDFAGAIALLKPMLKTVQSADIFNLMGYSLRKSGDLAQAGTYYEAALQRDAYHLGALEYQGELFLELGQVDAAMANLGRLAALCPQGCEERRELETEIQKLSTQ